MSRRSCSVSELRSPACELTLFITLASLAAVFTLASLALPWPWQPEQSAWYLVWPSATLPTGAGAGGGVVVAAVQLGADVVTTPLLQVAVTVPVFVEPVAVVIILLTPLLVAA